MRITLPSNRISVLRHNTTMGVKLIERKLNQHPMYLVTYNSVALHIGRNKGKMESAFRRYQSAYDRVLYAGA